MYSCVPPDTARACRQNSPPTSSLFRRANSAWISASFGRAAAAARAGSAASRCSRKIAFLESAVMSRLACARVPARPSVGLGGWAGRQKRRGGGGP